MNGRSRTTGEGRASVAAALPRCSLIACVIGGIRHIARRC